MLSLLVTTTISCTFGVMCSFIFTVKKISFRLDGISLALPVRYRLNDWNGYLLYRYRLASKHANVYIYFHYFELLHCENLLIFL